MTRQELLCNTDYGNHDDDYDVDNDGKPLDSVNAVPSGCQSSQGVSPKYVIIECKM